MIIGRRERAVVIGWMRSRTKSFFLQLSGQFDRIYEKKGYAKTTKQIDCRIFCIVLYGHSNPLQIIPDTRIFRLMCRFMRKKLTPKTIDALPPAKDKRCAVIINLAEIIEEFW